MTGQENKSNLPGSNELAAQRTELATERTDLAVERTVLAHERTLMAWVRTAVSMISFGFTLYKFFEELRKAEHTGFFSPRIAGMAMIVFGVISLLLAQVQHNITMKKIKQHYPNQQRSISSILATLVLIFGFALFLVALFRQ